MNEGQPKQDLNDLMHAETRREISDVKRNAEETLRDFLTLKTEVHLISTNLHNLDERLNQGVSKTAFKTYEKVNEIAVILKEHDHKNKEQDTRMDVIDGKILENRENSSTIIKWVLAMSSSILLSVLGLAIWVIQRMR